MTDSCRVSKSLGSMSLLVVAVSCGDPRPGATPIDDEAGTGSGIDTIETDETDDESSHESSDELPADTSTGDSTTGESCGGELYSATAIPPNVLIVLDRSGSMQDQIAGTSKWNIARAALEQVVIDHGEAVFFGLMLYPGLDELCEDGMGCGPGNVFVDVGPDTAQAIIDTLEYSQTCSLGTPTAETLAPLRDYAGLADPQRPNYVLLITDGKSSCGNPVPEVEALMLEDPVIETFVVGFGDGVDAGELSGMAGAGGHALPGNPNYYQADDAQALASAFADIAGDVLSCSYLLDQVPPNPDELYIYVDDMLIERDQTHIDGWDYDSPTNHLTFYGPACKQLQSGEVLNLEIVFGCPTVG